jgi:hypothetical protein
MRSFAQRWQRVGRDLLLSDECLVKSMQSPVVHLLCLTSKECLQRSGLAARRDTCLSHPATSSCRTQRRDTYPMSRGKRDTLLGKTDYLRKIKKGHCTRQYRVRYELVIYRSHQIRIPLCFHTLTSTRRFQSMPRSDRTLLQPTNMPTRWHSGSRHQVTAYRKEACDQGSREGTRQDKSEPHERMIKGYRCKFTFTSMILKGDEDGTNKEIGGRCRCYTV